VKKTDKEVSVERFYREKVLAKICRYNIFHLKLIYQNQSEWKLKKRFNTATTFLPSECLVEREIVGQQ
jgi:hypothetical protein